MFAFILSCSILAVEATLSDWLRSLRLPNYLDSFVRHGWKDVSSLAKLTDAELASVSQDWLADFSVEFFALVF